MNVFARYAVFVLVMGLIILFLANLVPSAYDTVLGVVKVARIPMHSELSIASSFLEGVTSVDSLISSIKAADRDSSISAILLDINSPGGGVVASYEVVTAIKQVSKPVITMIREVGASGAYWAAIASDYVFANELSSVGSVGVIGSYLVFEGLMDQYGVSEVRAVSGEQKDFGSPFRNLTEQERVELNDLINKTFQFFFNDVVELRNLTSEGVEQVKSGKIFLGIDALELGLVDELGGINEVESYLKLLLDAGKIEYVEQTSELSILDLLMGVKNEFQPFSFINAAPFYLKAS